MVYLTLTSRERGVASMAVYKVNVSLPEELVSEVDETALELGLSRSGFIAEAATRYVADVRNLSAEERRRKDLDRARATFKRLGAKLNAEDLHGMMDQLRGDRERGATPGPRR